MRVIAAVCLIALAAGCAPPPPGAHPAPVGVYVRPSYPMPAPGYVWMRHPSYGWGWRHPRYGWHRGWPP
jgi:hypothetical protein